MASGVFLAAAAFLLLMSLVAWFMPKFLLLADSRWAKLLPAISFLFIMWSANRFRRAKLKRRA
jgi:hypothetical protein